MTQSGTLPPRHEVTVGTTRCHEAEEEDMERKRICGRHVTTSVQAAPEPPPHSRWSFQRLPWPPPTIRLTLGNDVAPLKDCMSSRGWTPMRGGATGQKGSIRVSRS
jgi:hypothetical protein